jgi:hypothetical protein
VRYENTNFDYASEWPLRMAVVQHRGVPTHRVLGICHLATDGLGGVEVLSDLAARDPATGLAKAPVTAMQPLEQARWQCGPAGQRQSNAALRYWERLLRAIPPRRFGDSADKRQPRYWEAGYRSAAIHLAVRMIAARTRISTASVLLAAFAVGLARVTGSNPVVAQLIGSNRFRPGLAGTVSPITQTGLCVIDVADITFDEAVARAWRGATGAYKHAYYDPVRHHELIAALGSERGEEIDVGCFYNDRTMMQAREEAHDAGGALPTAQELCAALPRSAMRHGYQSDLPNPTINVVVSGMSGAVDVTMLADTHQVSPADVEATLREMEAVAAASALDPAAPTAV